MGPTELRQSDESVHKEGWVNGTEQYRDALARFVAAKMTDYSGRVRADGLEFSAGSPASDRVWRSDDSSGILRVEVLYDPAGKPTQLHGVAKVGGSQSSDVYLTRKVLEEFLVETSLGV